MGSSSQYWEAHDVFCENEDSLGLLLFRAVINQNTCIEDKCHG
jgi:hypothetical protein